MALSSKHSLEAYQENRPHERVPSEARPLHLFSHAELYTFQRSKCVDPEAKCEYRNRQRMQFFRATGLAEPPASLKLPICPHSLYIPGV
jgi:hypothetical protein